MNRFLLPENIVPVPVALSKKIGERKEKNALDYEGRTISYRELGYWTAAFAKIVSNLAEKKKVAIFCPNIPEFVLSYYGTLLSGNVAAPINYVPLAKQLKTKKPKDVVVGDELIKQLEYTDPEVIVVADIFWPMLERTEGKWLKDAMILVVSPRTFLPDCKYVPYPAYELWNYGYVKIPKRNNVLKLFDLLPKSKISPSEIFGKYESENHSVDEVTHLQYTGGTTGPPKGAELTHRNLISNALQCREQSGDVLGENEIAIGVLPFCHAYGLTVTMNLTLLSLGGEIVLVPKFKPKSICKLIEKKRATLLSGSNVMFKAIAAQTLRYDLSSLKYCTTGAGKTPEETIRMLRLAGVPLYEGYGQSEASPVISVCTPNEDKIGSVGRFVPETRVKIVDPESGKELSRNETGELCIQGPHIMAGYHNNPEETKEKIKEGWLYTGDIMRIDEDSFLYFIDRKDNSGKVNGENVYGEPIRKFLLEYQGIKNCVVFFVQNEKTGQIPPIAFALIDESFSVTDFLKHMQANPLWTPHRLIKFDEKTFEQWHDPTLGKINFKGAKKYYLENHDKLNVIYSRA